MSNKLGKFIAVDGIDGSGKTTICNYIADAIDGRVMTAFGEGPIGKEVRKVILTKDQKLPNSVSSSLIFAAVVESFHLYVMPALRNGENIILDRFMGSTYSYQVHSHPKDNLYNEYWRIYTEMLKLATPDIYIYMDVSIVNSNKRLSNRSDLNYLDTVSNGVKEKLIEGFRYFSRNLILPNSVIVDANEDLIDVCMSIDMVLREFEAKKE
jgi:dTMP kinase